MASRIRLETAAAPPPPSFMSQGIRKGSIVQVTGQGPVDSVTGKFVGQNDIEAQTIKVLENVEAILQAGGASFRDVVMIRAYLTTRDNYAPMNATYEAFLSARLGSAPFPARTCVMTGLPNAAMLVEIDALAVLDDSEAAQ